MVLVLICSLHVQLHSFSGVQSFFRCSLCFLALLQPSLVTWLAIHFVLKLAVVSDPSASVHYRNLLAHKTLHFPFRSREAPGERMKTSSGLER